MKKNQTNIFKKSPYLKHKRHSLLKSGFYIFNFLFGTGILFLDDHYLYKDYLKKEENHSHNLLATPHNCWNHIDKNISGLQLKLDFSEFIWLFKRKSTVGSTFIITIINYYNY